jgi:hypothetical protein
MTRRLDHDPNVDRRNKIIEYVRKYPKTTKTNVIKYMNQEGSSIMTTHSLIADLISGKILTVQKDKPNSQIHHLIFNDESAFNRIDKELSEIKSSIDLMDEFKRDHPYIKENKKSYIEFYNVFFPFYYRCNIMMLHRLLVTSNKKIHSENYFRLLNKRVVELMLRLDKLEFEPDVDIDQALTTLKYFFNEFHIKKTPENTRVVDNLKTIMVNFRNVLFELNE